MKAYFARVSAVVFSLAAFAAFELGTSHASAGIIGVTGAAQHLAAPTSTEQNAWESNRRVRVFQEASQVTLDRDVAVDFIAPGLYRNKPRLNRGVLAEGTTVNSYLIHQDGKNDKFMRLAGSVKFDEVIVGVIVKKFRIADSDVLLGSSDTAYETFIDLARGLEMRRGGDEIRLSANMRRIYFKLATSDSMDEIRVITQAQAVPAPGCLALLGLASLIANPRRRRA
jgi:hypothetical protein